MININAEILKRNYLYAKFKTATKQYIIPDIQGWLVELINVNHHINRLKNRNQMLISLDVKKAIDNPTPLHDKSTGEIGATRNIY